MAMSVRAVEPAPPNLDIREVILQLSQAGRAIDEALAPVELADKITAWEKLVEASASLQGVVAGAIKNSEAAVDSLKARMEQYQGVPAKVEALRGRIDSLQAQADQFILFQGELEQGTAKLKSQLEKLKSDPEVQSMLELEVLSGKVDAALQMAEDAVPDFLQEQ